MKPSHDPFASLDWRAVRNHYDARVAVHNELARLHRERQHRLFARLLLGVSDPTANYSAAEHGLGPKILQNSDAEKRLWALADRLRLLDCAHSVPEEIRAAALSYLGIGVGSEASCLMNPRVCWVANTRTLWAHLLIKHADDADTANEALALYRVEDAGEMAYRIWSQLHRELDPTMTRIAERATQLAKTSHVKPGALKCIWADAVSNALYEQHHG